MDWFSGGWGHNTTAKAPQEVEDAAVAVAVAVVPSDAPPLTQRSASEVIPRRPHVVTSDHDEVMDLRIAASAPVEGTTLLSSSSSSHVPLPPPAAQSTTTASASHQRVDLGVKRVPSTAAAAAAAAGDDASMARQQTASTIEVDIITAVRSNVSLPPPISATPSKADTMSSTKGNTISKAPTIITSPTPTPRDLLILSPTAIRSNDTTTTTDYCDHNNNNNYYQAMNDDEDGLANDEIPSTPTSSRFTEFVLTAKAKLQAFWPTFSRAVPDTDDPAPGTTTTDPNGTTTTTPEKTNHDDDDPDALYKNDTLTAPSLQPSVAQRVMAVLVSPLMIYSAIFVGMAAGLTYGALNEWQLWSFIDWEEEIKVAFAGSSYLFVNDIPRLAESISAGQIVQDSCLHTGGSLASLLMTGNGMYRRWQTTEAMIAVDTGYGYVSSYDFGACSVHQLIAGYDKYIKYENDNKAYYNDGHNPCILDSAYLTYKAAEYKKYPPEWDYIVLADQSKRMASSSARYDTVDALVSVYAPLIKESGAIPAIVDTHAFWSSQTNMTGLTDIPTFTRLIYEGVAAYQEALAESLPEEQAPIIIPIGLAYLTVWEENYDMWTTLFLSDAMHASLYGSYLFGCVLYTKLFGHLPKKEVTVPEHIEYLFVGSRYSFSQTYTYPTQEEASYLRSVAKRVVLNGYIPKSFTANSSTTTTTTSTDSQGDDGSSSSYYDDYAGGRT